MRVNKYRAWDDVLLRYLPPMTIEEIGNGNFGNTNWYQLTLEQWTGLYDSKRTEEYPNGQPIYEGDIIEVKRIKDNIDFLSEVVWDDDGACFLFQTNKNGSSDLLDSIPHRNKKDYWSYYDSCEVVGNIHESEDK